MRLKSDNSRIATLINLFTGVIAMVIQLGVHFVLSPYIVNNIGEAANGFTQLANNFVSYATLLTLAFNSMASRFIAVNYHKGDKDKVNAYYTAVIICNVGVSIILIPVFTLIVVNLNSIIIIGNNDYRDIQLLFTCVFVNFFFSLISSVFSIAFYVINKVYVQNIINLIRHIANALLLLLVFRTMPARMYYVSMIACFLSMVLIPINYLLQGKNMPGMRFDRLRFKLSTVVELVKSGIWNTINQCGNILMTGLDLLLSNLFVDPVSMGILAISKTIPTAIIQLSSVINTSFAPALTKDWAKGNGKEVLNQLRNGMKISSIMLSIPIMTFCVFSVQFYRLWMPSIDSKQLALLSFLACMSLIPWAGPQILYNVFTTTNKLKANSITYLLTGGLNCIIVWLLLNTTTLGVYAIAGVSSVLSIGRNMVFTAPYTARILNLKWTTFYKDVLFSLLCCAINTLIGTIVRVVLSLDGWLGLAIMVLTTAVCTFVIELLLVLNKEERHSLLSRFYHS